MRHNRSTIAMALALGGVASLSLMDAFMKSASLAIGVYSAALLRAGIGAALIAPIWLWRAARWPSREALRIHLLRGTVSTFMALSFFYAITKLALAEAIAISFVAPLIALYLAAIQLGETVSAASVRASLLGFAGTLVIVSGKLGSGDFDRDSALGLAAILFSALLYAWNFIIIRKQALLASPEEATTFHSAIAFVILALAAPFLWVWPDSHSFAASGLSAVLTVTGSLLITAAYARAEAQWLVPLEYSGFVWATLFGLVFFGEWPGLATLIGAAMIVAGCWLNLRASAVDAVRTEGAAAP